MPKERDYGFPTVRVVLAVLMVVGSLGLLIAGVGDAGGFAFFGLLVWPLIAAIALINYNPRKEEGEKAYAEDMEQFTRQQKVWEMLYYCYRDDVVFTSDNTAVSAPVENLVAFLDSRAI